MLDIRSEKNLVGVHPELVKVVRRAFELMHIPAIVYEGVRTIERERMLIKEKKSSLTDPYDCRHVPIGHPPYSRAVDIVPLVRNQPTWKDRYIPLYEGIRDAIQAAGHEFGIPIRSGADWKTFKDYPHHELPKSYIP